MNNIRKELLLLIGNKNYEPMKLSEISNRLNIEKSKKEVVKLVLEDLIDNEMVELNEDKRYEVCLEENEVIGTYRGNAKGFAFLSCQGEEDFYIYKTNTKGAIDGDIVLATITRQKTKDKKAEVKVVKILEENQSNFIGTFEDNINFGFVVLDNRTISDHIYIPKKNMKNAQSDDKVVIKITKRAEKDKSCEGEVIEVLGNKNQVGLDVLSIAKMNDILTDFPKEVLEESERISDEVLEKDIKGRLDLRNDTIITIDGDDSKDLDDAISLTHLDNGNILLGVHIADVSHYVQENTYLDKEARERATSVYLVDRVIPMLPKKLSNGICSLNPNVDRLTLSCIMEMNKNGDVVSHRVVESVIKSTERMTYSNVKKILVDNDIELLERYSHIVPMLKDMENLAKMLIEKRNQRGTIDFDFQETKVIINEEGKPIEIKPYDRNIATRLIEEFMILCNEVVSKDFSEKKLPFVYRVHEEPNGDKLGNFENFIMNYGYSIAGISNIKPKDFQNILNQAHGKKEENAINLVMLRSMQKARYSHINVGHFGLASEFYSHFTSPIRRYPDLQIHRIIKKYLHGELNPKKMKKLESVVAQVSENSSIKELKAQRAELDSVELKKAEFMLDKIGEVYEGIVVGVVGYGLYVQLKNTVEGLIHISKLEDDYYIFDEQKFMLVGKDTNKTFTFGDKVKVEVEKVDLLNTTIDFKLLERIE